MISLRPVTILVLAIVSVIAGCRGQPDLPAGPDLEPFFALKPQNTPWNNIVSTLGVSGRSIEALALLLDQEKNLVYGYACGVGGGPPQGRLAIFGLVSDNRWMAIRYVLRHGNLAGRVYAAEALVVMSEWGMPLPEQDLGLISSIRTSSACLEQCEGCNAFQGSPQKALAAENLETASEAWRFYQALGWINSEQRPDRDSKEYVDELVARWKRGEVKKYYVLRTEIAKTFVENPQGFLSVVSALDEGDQFLSEWLEGIGGYTFTATAVKQDATHIDAVMEHAGLVALHTAMSEAAKTFEDHPVYGKTATRVGSELAKTEVKIWWLN